VLATSLAGGALLAVSAAELAGAAAGAGVAEAGAWGDTLALVAVAGAVWSGVVGAAELSLASGAASGPTACGLL